MRKLPALFIQITSIQFASKKQATENSILNILFTQKFLFSKDQGETYVKIKLRSFQ